MINKRIKILGSAVLTTSLVFSTAYAALAAPAKSTKDVTTGRTEQKRQTGVITCDPVTVPHYAESVTLSGTVVIDGPQLVLKVNDVDVSAASNLQKIADKTWTYSYAADLWDKVGDVNFNLTAYTIYANGMPSPDIHTSAAPVTQIVHVPYVKNFEYINLSWDDYDRPSNTFSLSYNIVKVWDDNSKEPVDPKVSASVLGTENYTITAHDITHENDKVETLGTITPPVKVKDFSAYNELFANYDKVSNIYDLTFTLHKDLSNGTSEDTLIYAKVEAGKEYTYTAVDNSSPGAPYAETFKFTAPAAPAASVITVRSTTVTVTSQQELANNEDKNNYKVTYNLTITLSNGESQTFENKVITIPYNPGNNTGSKDVTDEELTIGGNTYKVTYTVTVTP